MALGSKTVKAKQPAPQPKSKPAATKTPDISGLENKIVVLENSIKKLQAQLDAVSSRPQPKPEPAAAVKDPRVDKMWTWLRKDRIFRSTL